MNEYNKNWIIKFNKNKNKELYKEVLNKNFPDNNKCRICNDIIYYYDSTFKYSNGKLLPFKKSYLSFKSIFGKNYYLTVCESCLIKEYPEYDTYNKSRVFNKLGNITMFAFDVPIDVANKWKKENYAITLENLVKRHGEIKGNNIWKNYLEKQSLTNKFEYKKEKYGWSEEQFKNYNLSRSVTIENLTKKHGKDVGLKIWNEYIEKQRYTCSKEYFIKEYGDINGMEKFDNFSKKRSFNGGYSKISILFFNALIEKLKHKNYTIYYQDNEYYLNINSKFYLVDFFIKELNLAIEFNGDIWHANPKIYEKNDIPINFKNIYKNLKAEVIWKRDELRIKNIKTQIKDVIIIWEKELTEKGINKLVDETIEKIKTYE